jgi:hypothetical protein
MIPGPLVQLENELRSALKAQQFAEADRLVPRYCKLAADHITSLSPGSAPGAEVASRVREVLQWSNLMLLLARAALADKLAPLPMISRYLMVADVRAQTGIEA